MIIYITMIIWVLFMWMIAGSGAKKSYVNGYSLTTPVTPVVAWITFGYIFFWISIRTAFADTPSYITAFNEAPPIESFLSTPYEGKGYAFRFMESLFKSVISADFHYWLTFITLLCGFPIVSHLRNNSTSFFLSAFLFMTTLNYTWMMNGIRQFIPAALLFGVYRILVEKKWYWFVFLVMLLSTIHFTTIIMIPMYWFSTAKPFGRRILLLSVFLITIIVFLEPFLGSFESSLVSVGYDTNLEQFAEDDGVNPLRFLFSAIPSLIAYFNRKKLENLNIDYIKVCINMSFIAAGLYFIGIFTSGIMIGRLPIFFELYNLTLIPFLIKFCFPKDKKLVTFLYMLLYFIFFYLQISNFWYVSDLTGPIAP